MKVFSFLMAALLSVGLTLGTGDAEARRLGGAKSFGMQRQATSPTQSPAVAPPTATAPAAASAAKAPGTATAPQASARPSWMGPVAGLAAGLGLAALASHFGFGEELASMLMIGLIVMAVMVVIGMVMRKRAAAQQPALAGAGGMQYARADIERTEPSAQPYGVSMPGSATADPAIARTGIPADFDVEGFVRNAKVHFIRLQAANDAGNLEDIRAFTTPEMFAELKMDIVERAQGTQTTDVVKIDADVIDVAEEAGRHIVSVRFNGLIRENKDGPVEAFEEIWNLVKPIDGSGGWLLAGIQQMH